MSRESKLAKNTLIYSIGNFGTKILSFLIVPLYTYYINPEKFGMYDMLTTLVVLLIPVVTMQLSEGILCWMLDTNNNKQSVVHCVINIVFANMILSSLIFISVCYFFHIPYGFFLVCILPLKSLYTILLQITRGYENNKLYAISGIMYSAIFLSTNLLLVIVFRMDIKGLFISEISTLIFMIIFVLAKQREIIGSVNSLYPKKMKRELIQYSLPLIPNSVAWWIINLSDRLIIKAFLGNAANGLYALSNKFPAIIQTITSIFYLAWQETAMVTYNNEDRETFYGMIFRKFYKIAFSISYVAISFTEIVIVLILSADYKSSWKYAQFLYLGTIFNAFASFYNISYLKEKKTKEILETTLLGAIVNLIANFCLIKSWGLYAACISTFVSNFILFIVRVFRTRKSCPIDVNWVEFGLFTGVEVLYAIVFSLEGLYPVKIILAVISVIMAIYLNLNLIKKAFSICKMKILSKN